VSKLLEGIVAIEGLVVAFITIITTFGGLWLKKRWFAKSDQHNLEKISSKNS
tara:strand:+ start:327 stop:482 length:156 start_codon:yes stop_codon:yes gene_type:complete